jgi:hypothetical protein
MLSCGVPFACLCVLNCTPAAVKGKENLDRSGTLPGLRVTSAPETALLREVQGPAQVRSQPGSAAAIHGVSQWRVNRKFDSPNALK